MGNKNSSDKKEVYVLSYTNGDKYDGEVVNGVREGFGTYFYHNGDKYEGMWQNNKKHGMGTLYYKDGNLYIGQWKNSEKEGMGTLYLKNGEKYYGEFKNGKKNGKGFLISPDYNKFIGFFKDNKKHGRGVLINVKSKKKAKEEWNEGILLSSIIITPFNSVENGEQYIDASFENYIDDQIDLLKNQRINNKLKSKYFTLEVAKYFKARIPNNYFDAVQFVTLTSDLIYENPHVTDWSEDEVCEWLYRLGLGKLNSKFRNNYINGLRFIKLNVLDLKETLCINDLKDIKFILKSIDFLRIFVKLKLDYEDSVQENRNREVDPLGKRKIEDDTDAANHSIHKSDHKTLVSNTMTNTNKNSEDDEIKIKSGNKDHKESAVNKINESDEIIVENQEYSLTKASISNYY